MLSAWAGEGGVPLSERRSSADHSESRAEIRRRSSRPTDRPLPLVACSLRVSLGALSIQLDSIPNALHILQEHLLASAVIEFCGPAVGVASDSLSGFKGAVIFQEIRDAGRPE